MSGRYTDNFFMFEGKGYKPNTGVTFKQEYLDTASYNGQKIWKHAYYSGRTHDKNGDRGYIFCMYHFMYADVNFIDYAGWFIIYQSELDKAIETIDRPYEIELVHPTKLKDWECPEVMVMWPIYIIAMIFGTVFTQVGTWWAFCSFLFFAWRHKKLWE